MADVTNEIMTNDKTKILSGEFLNFYTPRRQRIRSFKVYFSPKQEGSGTPSPENVRPISGWTGVEVNHCGKNLFDRTGETVGKFINSGGIVVSSNGWSHSEYIPIKGGQTYTFNPNTTAGGTGKHILYDISKNFIDYIDSGKITFSAPNNACFIRFSYRSSSENIQLELGSEATEYTPYKTNLSIPEEYQEVEYIESTGTQLIKTDLVPQFFEEDEFYMRFAYTNTSKTQIFYGVNNNAYMLQGVLINGGLRAYDTCNYNYTGSAPFVQNEWIEYSIKNKILTCKELTGNLKDYTSNNDYILCLFGKYPETSTLSFMRLS